ncbi:MAG: lamin tail domain-containing protein [Bacteroidales bacterium]|jgi:hypothetical protein|nr:lamin tail domain-containing protein [Bacteroidales bacterium]
MKLLACISILFFCHSSRSFAQWIDGFSDGDFANNPSWRGNASHFMVEDGWLRLHAPAATATSCLSTASDIVSDAAWEFVFKMDFNPSSSNHAKVYLISDRETLASPLNGYYLRLGHTDDDICLFRQNGNVTEKLITGRAKALDTPSCHVRVLVTRDRQGFWTLKTDLAGGRDFILEGSTQDKQISRSAYFGVVCTYTATRSTGFYFGDFRVDGSPYTDTEPPAVTSCTVDGKQAHIAFSEPVASVSAPLNRFFDMDDEVRLDDVRMDGLSEAILSFADELECGFRYILTVKGLEDMAGNVMRDTALYLSVPCRADPYDIVIGEIMANPSPAVRLPEYEYIELYNRSGKNIELEGWTFTYGNTSKTLPAYLFPAGGYLLLVHPAAVPDLSGYGATLPVLGSLTAISNAGQYLQLGDSKGTVISWVDFTVDWYADPLKTDGGWSLEQINPELVCSVASNWEASTGKNGGTPGRKNSAHASVSGIQAPEIIRIAVPDAYTIILYVSNPLGNILPDVSLFTVNPPVSRVNIEGNHFDRLRLQLQSPLREGEWYDLSVAGGVTDCDGYDTPSAGFRFALPQYPDSLDVVINEILFNPVSGGYTFVELYNRSQKAVQAGDLQLSLRDASGKLSTPVALTDEPFLLLPGQYLVTSRNTDAVMQQYGAANRSAFLQMPGMPSLTRESGRLVLLNKSLRVVDEVHYNSKQHVDFLKTGSGVSLERLNPDHHSLDPGNWHTAAQTEGFGTPGRQNSQYIASGGTLSTEVSLNPDVFSPDNDGIDDVLNISYRFDVPSLTGEVIIFDSAGRKTRRLMHQQLLATEGTITWDGSDDKGRKALTGVYIVFFQAYNSNGVQKIFKKPCVLAGKQK